MSIVLPPLPYARDALAPHISAETLDFHYGKHHQAYVNNLNGLIAGTEFATASLEEIVCRSNGPLFNNAAQVWNHGFYWMSLSDNGGKPSDELAQAIEAAFGSQDKLIEQLVDKGTNHFASGWVWLVTEKGKLAVEDSHDAETLADQGKHPLLVLDVWEHAYYVDYRNARPKFVETFLASLANWDFAAKNFAV